MKLTSRLSPSSLRGSRAAELQQPARGEDQAERDTVRHSEDTQACRKLPKKTTQFYKEL